MARNELVILDPRSQPVKALISAQDEAFLGPGEWAELDNLRVEKGLLTCRGGMSPSSGTVMAAGAFRGIWTGYWHNSFSVVVAVEVGGAVRILRSTDMVSWTELTAASGKYGNTRLTAGNQVRFTLVPKVLDTEGTPDALGSALIAVNGVDEARALYTNQTAAKIADVTPPERVRDMPVKVVSVLPGYFMPTQSLTGGDLSSSGAEFEFSLEGSDPNLLLRLTISSAVATGDDATVAGNIFNITVTDLDRQMLIGLDTSYGSFWEKVKIEANSETIWDPSSTNYPRPMAVSMDNTYKQIWVLNYPRRSALTDITSFTFTWVADASEAPSSDQIVDFFLFALGSGDGIVKSDGAIALTSMNSGSGTESPGIVYSTYETQYLKHLGAPVLNDLRLPRSPLLNGLFYAPVAGVTTAERDAGVDRVNFYVKETGATTYRYFYTRTLTSYAGTWSYGIPSGEGVVAWVYAGPDHFTQNFPEVELPSAFNRAIPSEATEVCWANNRLLIGKSESSNLVISDHKLPFRTRQLAAFEQGNVRDDLGTTLSLEGETVKAIVPIAASTAGSSSIFVFTDQNVYALAGHGTSQLSQVGRVANVGTQSPYSIVGDKGTIAFVDNEMQVRIIVGGSMQSISRQVVDDKLKGIPGLRRPWISGAMFGDRYHIAYTPTGESKNTKILLWDPVRGMWTTDTPPIACEALAPWFDTSKTLRFGVIGKDGSDLRGYEYDLASQSQDLGTTDITCGLRSYELHSPDGGLFHVGRCKAMIDDVNSASASIVRAYLPSGVSQTTALSLDTSQDHIYREDRIEGATVTGGGQPVGPRCRISFSVPLRAGKRIRFLSLEFTPLGGGHERP